MRVMIRENEELRRVLAELCRTVPAAEKVLHNEAFLGKLDELCGHDKALCRKVLELYAPLLAEPMEGTAKAWLERLCDRLSDNLFPDADHPRCDLTDDEQIYLRMLEAMMGWNLTEFDPLTDVMRFDSQALQDSRVAEEYGRFRKAVVQAHVLPLMRISREVRPFDPASHTIGVHNVALHTAIMAVKAGLPVDLPLVSAAAFGHDLGKFGCRGDDARRIPYLHYYYTWQWFSENDMEEIGHVSANHSTWDLEFENLPVESLLLIYADFRVRGIRGEDGREHIRIYSLAEAYEMIFSKLYDMTPEKQRRYQTVYDKLRDFERLLCSKGVPTEMDVDQLGPADTRDISLLGAEDALQKLCDMTLSGSIRLMRTITTDQSFDQLMEHAKSEKNLQRIRTYLLLLQEYSTYMTKNNKKKTLGLLYELLMHPDGDVRRIAGQIMGRILANSGPKYRKERPVGAKRGVMIPTMMALLDESVDLWERYIEACLHPDRKIAPKHAMRISNSLKTLCETLFMYVDAKESRQMVEPILRRLYTAEGADRIVLVDALSLIPPEHLPQDHLERIVDTLGGMLHENEVQLQLTALRCLEALRLQTNITRKVDLVVSSFAPGDYENAEVLEYMKRRAMGRREDTLDEEHASRIYLSNLKSAVHWTVKMTQIDMLCDHAKAHLDTAFHTAMHLSNVLSVSEHFPVRQAAGEKLLEIAPLLTVDHINEITIDLLRELETGQDQISYVIPPYLGRLMCMLPEKELWEAETFLEDLVRGSAVRPARVALHAIGEMLNTLDENETAMTNRGLGVLMTGICHYESTIHQTALTVLCRDVLGSERISLPRRADMFTRLHKKLLTVIAERRQGQLSFFNCAAMLNHLYRFIVQCEIQFGSFTFPQAKPVAFFPGTFDPFSVGHKQIVEEIRQLGYEVYLAVDEFSWSKMPLPKLLRRQIVEISVADQWDTYLFPDDIPINIAMPEDLAKLHQLLPGREVYLVAGSDVIYNASAYRSEEKGSAAEYNHIIFCRNTDGITDYSSLQQIIRGDLKVLSLPPFFESVSSTRIREYVDRKLDISMLVDPVVQSFIYEYGFYVRSPELKNVMRLQDIYFHRCKAPEEALPAEMNAAIEAAAKPQAVILRARPDTVLGWAVGHTLLTTDLYYVLHSIEAAKYVRRYAPGRILMVHSVHTCAQRTIELCRMVLNELLARSLDSDHTYALCRCAPEDTALRAALEQLGFVPVAGCEDVFCVDMRAPVAFLQDVLLRLKRPHQDDPEVKKAVHATRTKMRGVLNAMFPGQLVLCFDSETLNQAVMERVQRINGVLDVPAGERRLGHYMCVPYGKILSNEVVPNTVTKTLHAEKRFDPDIENFAVVEYPGYSQLQTQARTLKSFRRPVILVDDLLHKGYRIEKLDRVFREENLAIDSIIVAIMSGYGEDLMRVQGRKAECEYYIPNLRYWLTESLLYPFIGGDSVGERAMTEHMLPSINLVLPYYYPNFMHNVTDTGIRQFSRVALENALEIMRVLERRHQRVFNTTLTIRRLGEALQQPRLPDKGECMNYDFNLPASAYLEEDLRQIQRICRMEKEKA